MTSAACRTNRGCSSPVQPGGSAAPCRRSCTARASICSPPTSSTPTDVPYRFEQADLLDHERVLELLEDIDVLLHIGNHPGIGTSPPQLVFNENVSMNENMFQGAAERGVGKIVFASTLQLIGSHIDRRTVINEPSTPSYPLERDTWHPTRPTSTRSARPSARSCSATTPSGVASTASRFGSRCCTTATDRVRVSSGEERPTDILEGFTGLSYEDAAALFLAVVRHRSARLPGVHAGHRSPASRSGTSRAHLVSTIPRFPPTRPISIDISTIVDETGWQPSPVPDWSGHS